MATKAKKTDVTEGDHHPLADIVKLWASGPTDKDVYKGVVDGRKHGLTVQRIADLLGVSRQHLHKQYMQPHHRGDAAIAQKIPDGFNPAEDVPDVLQKVLNRRAQYPGNETVFRSILRARIDHGLTMQEIADVLGRKREQVYRDYWTPWAVEGVKAMAAAEREKAA